MLERHGHMVIAPRGRGDPENLEYLWIGPEADKASTLVFLHEGLGSVSMWRGFPVQLAKATGCGVLVYSRKGYGKSDPCDLPRPTSYIHHEAENILGSVLDYWKIEKCILVGHSDGASIATIYAGQFKDNRLLGLVLMAPHFFIEEVSIAAVEEAKTAWETTDLREKLRRHHGDNVDCAFLGWNRVWLENDFREWNIEASLPEVHVPMLIIQGADDPCGTELQWQAAEEKCTVPVTVAALEGCRHSPYKESPEKTIEASSRFIAGLV